jgi:hypothetical protein
MLLPGSLLYAVPVRGVSCLQVAMLSLIIADLPLLLCVSLLIALLLSLLLGMILRPVIALLPISLRSPVLSVLIVPLLWLRFLVLLGPLLLTGLFGLGLLVLGFSLVRMAPVLVLLVMLCVHRNSDS